MSQPFVSQERLRASMKAKNLLTMDVGSITYIKPFLSTLEVERVSEGQWLIHSTNGWETASLSFNEMEQFCEGNIPLEGLNWE